MTSVDSRIVTMKFENSTFERSVSTTLGTLGKLKNSLNFSGSVKGLSGISSAFGKIGLKNPFANSKKGLTDLQTSTGRFSGAFSKIGLHNPFTGSKRGLNDLQTATNKFSVSSMTGGVTSVSKSFLAMSTVAITALSNITSKAVDSGLKLAKSLTLDPIMQGFHEYETNLNSIQTVLANTKDQGSTLTDVNGALQKLNTYSDKTIYNFSEMARNIGTFTAAGVDLKTSVSSIKGIANLAAVSGSNSQQASTAMYQLSQAIASGKVGLQDWNSVVNAGMGGAVFQKALARTAANMGTVGKTAVKVNKETGKLSINGSSFRESIMAKPGQKSWLTSDVLTNTLKQMSGDMTAAQLKAQGFTDAQTKAILSMAKTGVNAATKVKTLSQLMDTLKESVGSGWTQSFQTIFGNFNEAKKTWTSVSNVLGGLIQNSAKARNKILKDWKNMGGRDLAIQGISNAFKALMSVIGAVKRAFHQIFPPATGKSLFNLTQLFVKLTKAITPSIETIVAIQRIARGVFAVFDIVIQVVKGVIGVFGDLIGATGAGSGGFLKFIAKIADFIFHVDQAIKKGDALSNFFKGLSKILQIPIRALKSLVHWFVGLFSAFDKNNTDHVSGSFKALHERLSPLSKITQVLSNVWSHLADAFRNVSKALSPLVKSIGKAFGSIGDAIANAFSGENFSKTLDVINTGLFAAIVLMIKKFVAGDLVKVDVGGGFLGKVSGAFDQLTSTLKTMQAQIKADTLIKIAIAMALLTASIVALSLIDSKKLTKALVGVAISFKLLNGMANKLSHGISTLGALKLVAITGSLILLAGAMAVLSISVAALSRLDLKDLAKGLAGVAVMLTMMVLVSKPLSANSAGMIRAGAGMLVLAVGLKVMASAVKDFAGISWKDTLGGLKGIVLSLLAVAGAMRLMPKGMTVQAAGLVLIAGALKIMASAVKDFAMLSPELMVQGLMGLATSMLIIAGAMHAMPKNMLVQAAALVAVAAALKIVGAVVSQMGSMSMEQIAKGLGTLAGSLVILAAGLYLMSGSLAGSAALVIAAAALALLVPVLVVLGSMSWGSIVKGLTALAATFVVLGLAGLVMAPIVPVLLGLGAAILLIGGGMALAGAGTLAFAAAFGILVAAGTVGITVLSGILQVIIKAIPQAIASFANGIVRFANIIGKNTSAFASAFGKIIGAIVGAISRNAPKIGNMFLRLVTTAARVLVKGIPAIANAGLRIITGLLTAMRNHIGGIVTLVADIIVRFLNALGKALPRVIQAGITFIIRFINGMTRAINKNSKPLGVAGGNLAIAIINGMVNGIGAFGHTVVVAAKNMAINALKGMFNVFDSHSPSRETHKLGKYVVQGLANGLDSYSQLASTSATGVAKSALDTMKATMSTVGDVVAKDMDTNPVIAPVLDLSNVQAASGQIGSLLGTKSLSADVSYNKASAISSERQAVQDAQASAATAPETKVEFNQYNSSPKALSHVEIYRSTKNQLSLAKEALKV